MIARTSTAKLSLRQPGLLLLLGTITLAAALSPRPAAARIIVDTYFRVVVGTDSDAPIASGCSLRQAIDTLNNNTELGDCQRELVVGDRPNLIEFAPALLPAQLFLESELTVSRNLEIAGPGRDQLLLNGVNTTRILNNTAEFLELRGMTLTQGNTESDGGAVKSSGMLVVRDARIINSAAQSEGGGIYVGQGGPLHLFNSEISGNSSGFLGGGIHANGDLVMVNSQISNNDADLGGGLFLNATATITGSTIVENTAGAGGAINVNSATVQISGTRIENNQAGTGPALHYGFIGLGDGSRVEIRESLLIDQGAPGTGGAYLVEAGKEFGNGELVMENSTLVGDRGIRAEADLVLLNSTLMVSEGIALKLTFSSASARLANSIIVSEGNDDCNAGLANLIENSHNIFTDGDCTAGGINLVFADPMLGQLADNGGDTLTLAPLPGSPAIDAGNSFCPARDQRGFNRDDGQCDIGAFEAGATDRLFVDGFE